MDILYSDEYHENNLHGMIRNSVSQHGVDMAQYLRICPLKNKDGVELTIIPKTGVVSATLERQEVALASKVSDIANLSPNDKGMKQPKRVGTVFVKTVQMSSGRQAPRKGNTSRAKGSRRDRWISCIRR